MTQQALPVGYGRDEVEPGIAPLVEAVRAAGFETFASCEGHDARVSPDHPQGFGSVAFFADERQARQVHVGLFQLRTRLTCHWQLRASFLRPRGSPDWRLAWTLENRGAYADEPTATYLERSINDGRASDMPLLIEMLGGLIAAA